MAKKEAKQYTLEGRLIYDHLFVRDGQFNPEKPVYNATIAVDPGDPAVQELIQDALDLACDTFGDVQLDIDGGTIKTTIKDGDEVAADRAAKGKESGATKGLLLITASTQFNAQGNKAEGGVLVYDEEVKLVEPVNSGSIYPGSYGVMALTMKPYDTNGKGIKFYLVAYQKTKDGERLGSSGAANLFKPVGRTTTTEGNVSNIRKRTRAG